MSPMYFQTSKIIRHLCRLCLAGAGLFGVWHAAAAEAAPRGLSAEQKAALQTVTTVAAFRTAAMRSQTAAFQRLLTSGAFSAWRKLIGQMDPKTGPMGVADFINTAVLLVGPQTAEGGVCALYSPFQDVILLMQTDNLNSFSKVEMFHFLPGRVFRGEPLDPDVPPTTLVPGRGMPLTIALMKLFADTEKVFNQIAATRSPLAKYRPADAAQIKYIEKIMDTRNRCALTLLKKENAASLFKAIAVRGCLKSATAAELKQRLQPGAYQEQAESFAALPPEIRGGMEICHHLSSPERDLYAFMNKLFPRYIAIVTADVKTDGAKWTLEWFDINNSKVLYPLYEKGLSKQRK